MEEKLAIWIAELSIYIIAVPILIGFWRYKKLRSDQKAILVLVLLSAITESLSSMIKDGGICQNIMYSLYTIAEFLLLTFVYKSNMKATFGNSFIRRIVVFFLLVVASDIFWWSGTDQFNGYSSAVESLLVIFFALSYYYKTLRDLKVRHLEKEPLFWISTGVLLYFASSLFIFLFTNYVSAFTRTLFIIWGIHAIFNLLHYIFYSIALWVTPNH